MYRKQKRLRKLHAAPLMLAIYDWKNLNLNLKNTVETTSKDLCTIRVPYTVKSSYFVILLGENIFFRWTFLRKPYDFFWYWNLCERGLGIVQSHFGLGHCLGLKNSFFCRVTKLGDRHLISSPSEFSKLQWRLSTEDVNVVIVHVIGKFSEPIWFKWHLAWFYRMSIMTYRREITQKLQIQKYFFFKKWALNNYIQKFKQPLSTGIYFLDAYNHYITFFGKSLKKHW